MECQQGFERRIMCFSGFTCFHPPVFFCDFARRGHIAIPVFSQIGWLP